MQNDQDIRDLAASGRTIDAIKLYRERHNVGLKEAKEAVEALVEGRTPEASSGPAAGLADGGDSSLWYEVDGLLRAGNKIEAIRVYRAKAGGGLKEAKDAVDARARQMGLATKAGCFIATAAYGSPLAPEVEALRRYRDAVLLRSRAGRAFVRGYYHLSPPVAERVARSGVLRWIVRIALRPLIALCRRLDGR